MTSCDVLVVGPPATIGVTYACFPGVAMDQTVTPPNASWKLLVNGAPQPVTGQAWADATHLQLTCASAIDGVNDLLTWPEIHTLLRSVEGSMAKPSTRSIL